MGFAQQNASKKNGGVVPSLASGLCLIGHSLPLVVLSSGAGLQRSRSGMLSREENDAPAEPSGSLCLIPSSHSYSYVDVDPCSFLAFEAIDKDSVEWLREETVR